VRLKTKLIIGAALSAALLASIHADASGLDIAIAKAAVRHKLNADLYKAILIVESGLDNSAYNVKTHDYGMAQVNKHTAALYGFNVYKLRTDVGYNLNAGAKVLADFKAQYADREPLTWPCRYNIGGGPLKTKARACAKYLGRLNKAVAALNAKTATAPTLVFFNQNVVSGY
jgi:hypothetical protein